MIFLFLDHLTTEAIIHRIGNVLEHLHLTHSIDRDVPHIMTMKNIRNENLIQDIDHSPDPLHLQIQKS